MAGMDDFFSLLRGGGQPGMGYGGGTPNFREMGQTIPLSAGGSPGGGIASGFQEYGPGKAPSWLTNAFGGGDPIGQTRSNLAGMFGGGGGGGGGTMHPQMMQMIMSLVAHPQFQAMMKGGGRTPAVGPGQPGTPPPPPAAPAPTAPASPTAVGPGQPGQAGQFPSWFKPGTPAAWGGLSTPNWAGNFQSGWGPPPPAAGGGAPTAVGGGFPTPPTPTGTQPPNYVQPTDSSYQGGYG